jgi:hypothetical protein
MICPFFNLSLVRCVILCPFLIAVSFWVCHALSIAYMSLVWCAKPSPLLYMSPVRCAVFVSLLPLWYGILCPLFCVKCSVLCLICPLFSVLWPVLNLSFMYGVPCSVFCFL